MQVKRIEHPAAIKVGDLILMENHGIMLMEVKDFKCCGQNGYANVKLAEIGSEYKEFVRLKDLSKGDNYMLVIPGKKDDKGYVKSEWEGKK